MQIHALSLALLATTVGAARADEPAPLDSADAVARAALQANPELAAIEAQTAAMAAMVDMARAWPDPRADFEYSNMPLTTPWPGEHPMSGVQLRVSQTLLAPGKVDARVAEAQGRVEATRAQIATRQNQLAGAVAEGWYALAQVRQLRGVTEAHVALVQQLLDVATVSYEVGRAAQHELLALQTLHDRLADDLHDLDQRERQQVARLNAALHRPADAPLSTPDQIALDPAAGPSGEAVEAHPMLRELAVAATAEVAAAERAVREKAPDWTVSLGYRVRRAVAMGDEGEDFLSVGLSIPLPWFWNDERWESQAASHRASARALDARAQAERDRLQGEVGALTAARDRARQKAATYEGPLVEVAHRALDSAFAAYRVGRAQFGDLYQAEIALLDLERGAILARTEAGLADARLKTLTGAWVPAPLAPEEVR